MRRTNSWVTKCVRGSGSEGPTRTPTGPSDRKHERYPKLQVLSPTIHKYNPGTGPLKTRFVSYVCVLQVLAQSTVLVLAFALRSATRKGQGCPLGVLLAAEVGTPMPSEGSSTGGWLVDRHALACGVRSPHHSGRASCEVGLVHIARGTDASALKARRYWPTHPTLGPCQDEIPTSWQRPPPTKQRPQKPKMVGQSSAEPKMVGFTCASPA